MPIVYNYYENSLLRPLLKYCWKLNKLIKLETDLIKEDFNKIYIIIYYYTSPQLRFFVFQ